MIINSFLMAVTASISTQSYPTSICNMNPPLLNVFRHINTVGYNDAIIKQENQEMGEYTSIKQTAFKKRIKENSNFEFCVDDDFYVPTLCQYNKIPEHYTLEDTNFLKRRKLSRFPFKNRGFCFTRIINNKLEISNISCDNLHKITKDHAISALIEAFGRVKYKNKKESINYCRKYSLIERNRLIDYTKLLKEKCIEGSDKEEISKDIKIPRDEENNRDLKNDFDVELACKICNFLAIFFIYALFFMSLSILLLSKLYFI